MELLLTLVFYAVMGSTMLLTLIIVLRQFLLTVASTRLDMTGPDATAGRQPTTSGTGGDLPSVAVIVPAHNEERVIADSLKAMVATDYPRDRLQIIVVNDRSSDQTGDIIDSFAALHPLVVPLHRPSDATPGKSAALCDVTAACSAEILVFFDADYLPGPGLIRQLVAPFADPAVGATMGRVVPINSNANILTRLIDLERRGGYVVDQQMRQRWRLLPQFGGTAGAVRAAALREIGGWKQGHLTEDTWLTYALFLRGYDVAYVHEAACYEETPETWWVRYKQVRRWAYGHNDCMFSFVGRTLRARGRPLARRIDAAAVLLFYAYPMLACTSLPVALLGSVTLPVGPGWSFAALLPLFFGFGNLAPFFQIAVAAQRDGQAEVLRYLPLIFVSSVITLFAASDGFTRLLYDKLRRRNGSWDKTARFRRRTARGATAGPRAPAPAAHLTGAREAEGNVPPRA